MGMKYGKIKDRKSISMLNTKKLVEMTKGDHGKTRHKATMELTKRLSNGLVLDRYIQES